MKGILVLLLLLLFSGTSEAQDDYLHWKERVRTPEYEEKHHSILFLSADGSSLVFFDHEKKEVKRFNHLIPDSLGIDSDQKVFYFRRFDPNLKRRKFEFIIEQPPKKLALGFNFLPLLPVVEVFKTLETVFHGIKEGLTKPPPGTQGVVKASFSYLVEKAIPVIAINTRKNELIDLLENAAENISEEDLGQLHKKLISIILTAIQEEAKRSQGRFAVGGKRKVEFSWTKEKEKLEKEFAPSTTRKLLKALVEGYRERPEWLKVGFEWLNQSQGKFYATIEAIQFHDLKTGDALYMDVPIKWHHTSLWSSTGKRSYLIQETVASTRDVYRVGSVLGIEYASGELVLQSLVRDEYNFKSFPMTVIEGNPNGWSKPKKKSFLGRKKPSFIFHSSQNGRFVLVLVQDRKNCRLVDLQNNSVQNPGIQIDSKTRVDSSNVFIVSHPKKSGLIRIDPASGEVLNLLQNETLVDLQFWKDTSVAVILTHRPNPKRFVVRTWDVGQANSPIDVFEYVGERDPTRIKIRGRKRRIELHRLRWPLAQPLISLELQRDYSLKKMTE